MAEAGVQTTASSVQETALPAPPCTSWCLCLRFYLLPSQALPRGSPTATGAPGLGKAGRVHAGSRQGAASQPRLLDAAFRVNLGKLQKLGKDE